ncbi:MAG: hypothetical protein QOF83_2858 [Solirubrobacteraceae bacterium]|jgi:hypothetical protein|nr:hypothetical protein [Solirubrobacteraceae bacterium]
MQARAEVHEARSQNQRGKDVRGEDIDGKDVLDAVLGDDAPIPEADAGVVDDRFVGPEILGLCR